MVLVNQSRDHCDLCSNTRVRVHCINGADDENNPFNMLV